MFRHSSWSLVALLVLVPLAPPRQAATRHDDWELLGSRRVSFAAERDAIDIGAREGLFDALRIEVQDGDVEMFDVRVLFGNGADWSPKTRFNFREGSRSRVIDLPGEARAIRRVEFSYRSRFRRGRATVQLFGRKARPPMRQRADAGWDRIGTRDVDFRVDHDVIRAAGEGRFRSIRIDVEGGDIELYNLRITFGDAEPFSPSTRLIFRAGTRSRVIDLPGRSRVIRRIDFYYRSLLGPGRKATVHVYGRR